MKRLVTILSESQMTRITWNDREISVESWEIASPYDSLSRAGQGSYYSLSGANLSPEARESFLCGVSETIGLEPTSLVDAVRDAVAFESGVSDRVFEF